MANEHKNYAVRCNNSRKSQRQQKIYNNEIKQEKKIVKSSTPKMRNANETAHQKLLLLKWNMNEMCFFLL